MDAPTAASLGRLRRAVLIGLCAEQGIEVAGDATKATLIEELLRHHTAQRDRGTPPMSAATEKPGSSSTARPSSSESDDSTSTKTRRKTPKGPLKKRTTDSDKPLLLRTRSKEVQSPRPPSLKLQSGVAEPAPPADSIDELNGLDLESLNLLDKEIAPHKLEKGEKIGSGGFKDVYVGKYQITASQKRRVAIAEIRDQLSEMDIKEIKLLRDLRHENIVRFIGVSIPQEPRNVPCMVVTELCSNGDLYDYIRNVEAPSDDEIFRIMLETARGLEYLHTRTPTIIHRDVKSTNVLVSRNRTAKIADFGLARVRNTKRSKIGSLVGTVNWQAVELWSPKPNYNEKVDVWSAAMTFWETLQWHLREKKYPFQEMNEHQIYLDVGQKKLRPPTVSIRRRYGGEIVDLLDRMWDHLAKNRPTMTEVCEELELLIAMKRSTQEPQTTKPTTRAAAHHQH
ncbi:kinase-like protein [Acaromyces ingoldii]|uniref:Kinase-like protein n=1 Tax=Acaromyces ingoldii TaxID=215250 RepID=A0A316YLW3_9BASI|nr:kinase-like protein [Acaromyces ingoldii]PWN90540.1 kinase-like protein [Acaromyces ingoldii]